MKTYFASLPDNIKILVVDDEPAFLKIITDIFISEKPEYEVFHALNAKTGLKIAVEEMPDIILSDWDMPDINGIDFIKNIKEIKKLVRVPVIMVTGVRLTSNDLNAALQAGAIDYVQKPIDPIELIARTNSVLQLAFYQNQQFSKYENELQENNLVLYKNSELLKKLTKDIDNARKTLKTSLENTDLILKNISNNLSNEFTHYAWARFKIYFSKAHHSFFDRLTDKFPDLTPNEKRLCAFIRVGMRTKDISNITFQSAETIKSYRSRLRKKLNLGQDDNLSIFLSSF